MMSWRNATLLQCPAHAVDVAKETRPINMSIVWIIRVK